MLGFIVNQSLFVFYPRFSLVGFQPDMVIPSNLGALSATQYATTKGVHDLPVLDTCQPGRLARSSSEACARDLSGTRFLRSTKNPSTQFSAPQQQSPLCVDSTEHTSIEHSHDAVMPGDRPGPPTIHLFPPSPTQTTYSHHSTSLESDPLHSKQFWSYGSHSEDSGCPTTQGDLRDTDQTGEIRSNCLGLVHTDSVHRGSTEQDIELRGKLVESRTAFDVQSQRNAHGLNRQGAFRGSPQWRLIPRPLNLLDRGRSTTTAINVAEGTTLSSLLFPTTENAETDPLKHPQLPLQMQSQHAPEVHREVLGQQQLLPDQSDISHALHGLNSPTTGHFSAPPSTPSGRLHFVWTDLPVTSNPVPISSEDQTITNTKPVWGNMTSRTVDRPTDGVNLSTYLSTGYYTLKKDNSLPETHILNKPLYNPIPNFPPVEDREQKQDLPEQQNQEQHTRDQEPTAHNNSGGDAASPPLNALLTTSSSSEQSSTQRPPSSGPIHLLTHSDIHQLLSLTNIRVGLNRDDYSYVTPNPTSMSYLRLGWLLHI